MSDEKMEVEITLAPAKSRRGGRKAVPKVPDQPRIPRITRLMALAIHLRHLTEVCPCACAPDLLITDPWDSSEINAAVTEQALNLAAALIDHALAVFDLMQRDPVIEDSLRILRWVRRRETGQFKIRDCFCFHQAHFRKMDAMTPPVRLLEQHGYVRPAPKPNATGRPSEIYQVNPSLLDAGE